MRHFVKAVAFRKFSIPSLYQIHFKSDQIFYRTVDEIYR